MQQAEMTDLSPSALAAMRQLVGGLDDRGFLTQTPADVALQTGLGLDAVQEALKVLKTFDPPGIGAKISPSASSCNSPPMAAAIRWRCA